LISGDVAARSAPGGTGETVPVSLLLVTFGMNPAKGKGAISSTAHSAERGTILHVYDILNQLFNYEIQLRCNGAATAQAMTRTHWKLNKNMTSRKCNLL
jgi:hypothetical protein